MREQLELIPAPPVPLTDRQQAVLDAVQRAQPDGLDAEQAGAILHSFKDGRWAHSADEICQFCHRDGKKYLGRLADLGRVRYRRKRGDRPGGWVTDLAGDPAQPDAPFGEFPEGY